MKSKYLVIAAALLAGVFSSCGDSIDVPSVVDGPAQLVITLDGTCGLGAAKSVLTRAHGVLPSGDGNDEGRVNRVVVAVFKTPGGETDVIKEVTLLEAGNKISIKATEGSREILVVANAPAEYFAGVATKAAFISKAISLDKTTEGSGVQK